MAEGDESGDARPPRRIKKRQPTLIGMPLSKPSDDAATAAPPPRLAKPITPPGPSKPDSPLAAKAAAFPKPARKPAASRVEPEKRAAAEAPDGKPLAAAQPVTPEPESRDEAGEPEELEAAPTHVGPEPEAPAPEAPEPEAPEAQEPEELVGEPTHITELPGESTQVSSAAGGDSTQPSIEAPAEDELPFEPTFPAIAAPPTAPDARGGEPRRREVRPREPSHSEPRSEPRAEPRASEPRHTEPDPSEPSVVVAESAQLEAPEELKVEPTVVVDPASLKSSRAPVYSVDVGSGEVQLTDSPRHTIPEDFRPGPKKARTGMWIGVGAAVVVALLAVGGASWVVLGSDEGQPDDPSSVDTPPSASTDEPAVAEGSPASGEPTAARAEGEVDPEAGAEPTAEAPAEAEADGADDEGSPALGEVVPRETLEGFELELPRLARRARRLDRNERTRQATRLNGEALRAYRDGQYAEAERAYRESLTYETWNVAAVEGAARAVAQQGRLPEALAWAELAVERNPRSGIAYRILGDVWRRAGHPDEAQRAYRRGLRRRPDDRWLRQRLRDLRSED